MSESEQGRVAPDPEPAAEDAGRIFSGVEFESDSGIGAAAASRSTLRLWLRVLPGCLAAWAFPGLGHVVLGRFRRGVVLGLLVLVLFAGGLWLDGKVYRPVEDEPLSYLAALGAAGAGGPFLVAHGAGWGEGNITSPYHDYGNTFTLVAGLLNLLLVLDAYDVAAGRR